MIEHLPPTNNNTPRDKFIRAVCIVLGSICVGLAAAGLVLPLLPTTPFLLLAAALYFRGSKRMYDWLLNNRYFGSYIRAYRAGQGLPRRAKISAVVLLWLTIGVTILFAIDSTWVRALLLVIASGVTIYLLRLPTFSEKAE